MRTNFTLTAAPIYSRLQFVHMNFGISDSFENLPQGHLDVFSSQLLIGESEFSGLGPEQKFGVQAELHDGYGKFTLQWGPDTIAVGHVLWDETILDKAWDDVKMIYDGVHQVAPSWFSTPLMLPNKMPWMTFMAFPTMPSLTVDAWKELSAIALGLGFGVLSLRRSYLN